MRERPILFNGLMVQAILAGRKTQTRRVIKPQPFYSEAYNGLCWVPKKKSYGPILLDNLLQVNKSCPYGGLGDRLWVRETWGVGSRPHPVQGCIEGLEYRADEAYLDNIESLPLYEVDQDLSEYESRWRPSIHMPRWASRITLEITDARVERVRDIAGDDCLYEGIKSFTKDERVYKYWPCDPCEGDMKCSWKDLPRHPVEAFKHLWDSINASRGYGWEANPWVWVIEFKQVKQPKESK